MTTEPPVTVRPGYPPSPCTRVCTLDTDNVCVGCRRTLDEIVGWAAMTATEQWAVVRRLADRGD